MLHLSSDTEKRSNMTQRVSKKSELLDRLVKVDGSSRGYRRDAVKHSLAMKLRQIELVGVKSDDDVCLLHLFVSELNHFFVTVLPLREHHHSRLAEPLQTDTKKTAGFKDLRVIDELLEWSPDVSLSWFPLDVQN
jgi:hypothetical protein